ncbi:PREDICTED: general odorant-binding protein 69a-like [Nicrophorus vespilloides]|uniref:General odorant-binding protein 69a-like n=1 Tax=Nicrophorus vespilloides TaxID=110193 RepID=A0ABM1NF42_NICVS|nr:PREDICTED: general odorant-binding protein 69a-like [Nicrophorus vespilloides]XP_017785442.1 PREDICTED: general odorant-binding protein 69a-like [Nicrophorus vespilloides]XP_017785443.1 PREDICTED: general odorant-binding protein 69a-like [Nicrophorus vespilloides]
MLETIAKCLCIRSTETMMIKIGIFVIALVLFEAQAKDIHPDLQELADDLHNKCVSESGVTEEMISTARTGQFPEDQTFKCYLKCLYDTPKLLHEDGTINIEAAIEIIPDSLKNIYSEPIKKCGTQMGTDICDTCFKTAHCIFMNTKEHFYLI